MRSIAIFSLSLVLCIGACATPGDDLVAGELESSEAELAMPPGVCNYGAGQSLITGPVTVPEHLTGGCCTYTYLSHGMGIFGCPSSKTQMLGCAGAGGELLSWDAYNISGTMTYGSLPSGASACAPS